MWFEYLGTLVVGILFLAIFCEGSITFFYTDVVKLFGELTPRQFLRQYSARYVALILGLLLAFGFRAKIPDLPNLEVVRAWIGIPVSGVVIGRGASYIHDALRRNSRLGNQEATATNMNTNPDPDRHRISNHSWPSWPGI